MQLLSALLLLCLLLAMILMIDVLMHCVGDWLVAVWVISVPQRCRQSRCWVVVIDHATIRVCVQQLRARSCVGAEPQRLQQHD